ncbi:MAG: hypothetical protein K2Q12_11555, partial [Rickettsiales bacterium]|nr:hypothetical protein [Rickettsiales bacterium]
MEVKTVVSLHYGDSEIRVPLLLMYAAQPKVQFVSVDYGGLPPKELKVSPALSEDVKRLYQHLGSAAEEVELIVKKGPNGIHLDSLKTTNLPNRSNAH